MKNVHLSVDLHKQEAGLRKELLVRWSDGSETKCHDQHVHHDHWDHNMDFNTKVNSEKWQNPKKSGELAVKHLLAVCDKCQLCHMAVCEKCRQCHCQWVMCQLSLSVSWSDDPDQETTVCVRVLEVLILLVVVQHCLVDQRTKMVYN